MVIILRLVRQPRALPWAAWMSELVPSKGPVEALVWCQRTMPSQCAAGRT